MSVGEAISRCPFLHNISQRNGEAFAAGLATSPSQACAFDSPPDDSSSFETKFALFHGSQGVMPLPRSASRIPHGGTPTIDERPLPTAGCGARARGPCSSAPLASLSMGMPNFFGDFFHNMVRHQQQPQPQRTIRPQPSSLQQPTTTGGQCPLRKLLGPVAGWVFNKAGNLQCPTVIVQARAALASTRPVKALRPQALPVKLVAIAAIAAAANIPCGMWREHTEKFSLQWILAVHASIPFVAMLRKAVIMPKMAIILTIAAAVAGQAMGARLERERLKQRNQPAAAVLEAGVTNITARRKKASRDPAGSKVRVVARKAPAAVARSGEPSQEAQLWWSATDAEWGMGTPDSLFKQPPKLPANAAHLL